MFVLRLMVLGFLLGSLLFLTLVFRPAILLGVDGLSLDYSVGKEAPDAGPLDRECTQRQNETWKCTTLVGASGPYSNYRVVVDWSGCWEATPAGKSGKPRDGKRLSGCVDILDHVRLGNLVF